jgi:hypothetical protein
MVVVDIPGYSCKLRLEGPRKNGENISGTIKTDDGYNCTRAFVVIRDAEAHSNQGNGYTDKDAGSFDIDLEADPNGGVIEIIVQWKTGDKSYTCYFEVHDDEWLK